MDGDRAAQLCRHERSREQGRCGPLWRSRPRRGGRTVEAAGVALPVKLCSTVSTHASPLRTGGVSEHRAPIIVTTSFPLYPSSKAGGAVETTGQVARKAPLRRIKGQFSG